MIAQKKHPKGITPKAVRKAINKLYKEANILRKHKGGCMYDLRVHSLRKYFKTQLTALGVPHDYIEYMMGHTISTYDDVQSLGIDKLRNIYNSAGLVIKSKTRISKIDTLKEIIRAYGMNPEETLTKNALMQGAVNSKSFEDHENSQLNSLVNQLKGLLREEVNRK